MQKNMLKISTRDNEGEMKTAKFMNHRAKLSSGELEALFAFLGPLYLVRASGIMPEKEFLMSVDEYISDTNCAVMLSKTLDPFYLQEVRPGGYIVKAVSPIVQLRPHNFMFSKVDHSFHSGVLGRDVIPWGIQCSFPQIYTHSHSGDVVESLKSAECINTPLYKRLAQWMRRNTLPVPFLLDGKRVVAPFRSGKIDRETHLELEKRGLNIQVSE